MWGSDWPFLRAAERIDYAPRLTLFAVLFPREDHRRKILWEMPKRVIGFGESPGARQGASGVCTTAKLVHDDLSPQRGS